MGISFAGWVDNGDTFARWLFVVFVGGFLVVVLLADDEGGELFGAELGKFVGVETIDYFLAASVGVFVDAVGEELEERGG